jgi:hypothetical protein
MGPTKEGEPRRTRYVRCPMNRLVERSLSLVGRVLRPVLAAIHEA